VGVAGVPTPMKECDRPFRRNDDTRGVNKDGKRESVALGVEVTVNVEGVRVAVGEDGNTKRV